MAYNQAVMIMIGWEMEYTSGKTIVNEQWILHPF